MDQAKTSISEVCESILAPKGNEYQSCNFFVQAVAAALEKDAPKKSIGATVAGMANDIVARLAKVQSPWTYLGANPKAAMGYAEKGYLVIGGLAQSSGSGHVFVVAPGGPSKAGLPTPWGTASRGGAPMIYHGSAVAKLRSTKPTQVDIVFSRSDEKLVIYGAIPDPRDRVVETMALPIMPPPNQVFRMIP